MKKIIVLIISCLILSMNFSFAQKMTICDCVTQYTLMAEDMNNGLSEEAAMKKYEKTDLECSKLIEGLSDTEAMEMYECADWAKLSALMMQGSDIDPEMACGCVDFMLDAYGDLLKDDVDEDKWAEKYGEQMTMCEPLFMDEAALGMMMGCENFPKLGELMMKLMETE